MSLSHRFQLIFVDEFLFSIGTWVQNTLNFLLTKGNLSSIREPSWGLLSKCTDLWWFWCKPTQTFISNSNISNLIGSWLWFSIDQAVFVSPDTLRVFGWDEFTELEEIIEAHPGESLLDLINTYRKGSQPYTMSLEFFIFYWRDDVDFWLVSKLPRVWHHRLITPMGRVVTFGPLSYLITSSFFEFWNIFPPAEYLHFSAQDDLILG